MIRPLVVFRTLYLVSPASIQIQLKKSVLDGQKPLKCMQKRKCLTITIIITIIPITMDWLHRAHIVHQAIHSTYTNYILNIFTKWAYTCHNNNYNNIQNQNIHPNFLTLSKTEKSSFHP